MNWIELNWINISLCSLLAHFRNLVMLQTIIIPLPIKDDQDDPHCWESTGWTKQPDPIQIMGPILLNLGKAWSEIQEKKVGSGKG